MTLYEKLVGRLNIFEWALIALTLYLLQTVGYIMSSMVQGQLIPSPVLVCISGFTSSTHSGAMVGSGIKTTPSLCHIQIPADCVRNRSAEEVWILVCCYSS
jgi:hypothetical protein